MMRRGGSAIADAWSPHIPPLHRIPSLFGVLWVQTHSRCLRQGGGRLEVAFSLSLCARVVPGGLIPSFGHGNEPCWGGKSPVGLKGGSEPGLFLGGQPSARSLGAPPTSLSPPLGARPPAPVQRCPVRSVPPPNPAPFSSPPSLGARPFVLAGGRLGARPSALAAAPHVPEPRWRPPPPRSPK